MAFKLERYLCRFVSKSLQEHPIKRILRQHRQIFGQTP